MVDIVDEGDGCRINDGIEQSGYSDHDECRWTDDGADANADGSAYGAKDDAGQEVHFFHDESAEQSSDCEGQEEDRGVVYGLCFGVLITFFEIVDEPTSCDEFGYDIKTEPKDDPDGEFFVRDMLAGFDPIGFNADGHLDECQSQDNKDDADACEKVSPTESGGQIDAHGLLGECRTESIAEMKEVHEDGLPGQGDQWENSVEGQHQN